jgi:hypothetical protein
MATSLASDFKVYDTQFQSGLTETLTQDTNAFNAASAGALTYVTAELLGNYRRKAFLQQIANVVSRRDATSVSAASGIAPTQAEMVNVKIKRKIGPVESTLDALRAIGTDQRAFSFLLGEQIAKAQAADALNSSLTAVVAALAGLSGANATLNDISSGSPGTMTHDALAGALSKMGDAQASVRCWVMHSKVYFDLMRAAIADKIANVADVTIYGGSPGTFNRPVIVTDSASLVVSGSPDTYHTLGLVEAGGIINLVETPTIEAQTITGLENLVLRMQGEYALELGVKGFAWDVTNGGANPTAGALGTSTNWDRVAADKKLCAGCRVLSK